LFLSVGARERRRRRKTHFPKKPQPLFFHTLIQIISKQTSALLSLS